MTDPNSHSNPEECLVTHISFLWDVDFERKVLSGSAELIVERQTDTADKIVSSKFLPYWLDKPGIFLVFSTFPMASRWLFPILKNKSQYSKKFWIFIQSTHTHKLRGDIFLQFEVCVIHVANLFVNDQK